MRARSPHAENTDQARVGRRCRHFIYYSNTRLGALARARARARYLLGVNNGIQFHVSARESICPGARCGQIDHLSGRSLVRRLIDRLLFGTGLLLPHSHPEATTRNGDRVRMVYARCAALGQHMLAETIPYSRWRQINTKDRQHIRTTATKKKASTQRT